MYPFSRYFVIFCCETILSDLCVYHLILPPSSNRCHRRIDGIPLPSDRPIIEPLNHPYIPTHLAEIRNQPPQNKQAKETTVHLHGAHRIRPRGQGWADCVGHIPMDIVSTTHRTTHTHWTTPWTTPPPILMDAIL